MKESGCSGIPLTSAIAKLNFNYLIFIWHHPEAWLRCLDFSQHYYIDIIHKILFCYREKIGSNQEFIQSNLTPRPQNQTGKKHKRILTKVKKKSHSLVFQTQSVGTDIYKCRIFPKTIRGWNSLVDSLISAGECAEDSVSKHTLERALATSPDELLSLDISPVSNSDFDSHNLNYDRTQLFLFSAHVERYIYRIYETA